MTDLLTDDEKHALELSGELANLVSKIIHAPRQSHQQIQSKVQMEVGGVSKWQQRDHLLKSCVENDWAEVAAAFHVIQRYIMSNAAARAYPELCRPLGGII